MMNATFIDYDENNNILSKNKNRVKIFTCF